MEATHQHDHGFDLPYVKKRGGVMAHSGFALGISSQALRMSKDPVRFLDSGILFFLIETPKGGSVRYLFK
jgi:hypothetical protein